MLPAFSWAWTPCVGRSPLLYMYMYMFCPCHVRPGPQRSLARSCSRASMDLTTRFVMGFLLSRDAFAYVAAALLRFRLEDRLTQPNPLVDAADSV